MKSIIIFISIILLLVQSYSAAAWPAESQWNIVMKDGMPLSDPQGDAIKEKDVVGNYVYPCCYFFNNGTAFFFRMRLDDSLIQGHDHLKPFGWGIEIDSNANLSDYEWLIMVDGNPNSAFDETVTIQRNTVQAIIGDPSDHAEFINRTYSPSIGGYVNITNAADSSFGGNPDSFISWFVPYNDFLTLTGLNNFSAIRVFFGSSSNTMSLTEQGADLVGGTNMTLFTATSDWSTPMATVLTNGSINFVNAPYTEIVSSVIPGNLVYIRVNDSDRNTDNLSNQTLNVILNSSNGDLITITLTETNISTGIFTGSVQTVESTAITSDQLLQVYSPGTINATYNDTTSQGQNVLRISMINVLDVTPPVWDPTPGDQINEFGTAFGYDVNATDHTAIIYSVNDTTNFTINSSTGLITNKTVLNLGNYSLNITSTDTSLNSNSSIIRITVHDTTAPVWNPLPANQAIEFGSSFNYDVNASDINTPVNYGIDDVINFSIDPVTGLITNISLLNMGSYNLLIYANDSSGNSNSSSITVTVLYMILPETTIETTPPALSNSSNASFNFSSNKQGTFECRIDGGVYSLCTSPKSYSGLSDSSHFFEVRANDTAGNLDPSPATYTWTIDTIAPETTLLITPPLLTNSTNASFTFSGTGAAAYECSLDGEAYETCTSPKNYTGLVEGVHIFNVTSTDGANNVDPSPATYTWTIDTTAPETTLLITPPLLTNSTNASFTFSGTGAAAYECSLDGGAYETCTSPKDYTGLVEGVHIFNVTSIDGANNVDPSPATYTWTIDTTAPETILLITPPLLTNSTNASFTFSGTGAAAYECSLDGGAYETCSSPKDYTGLGEGVHTFNVTSKDGANNIDPSPVTYTWTIDTTRPVITLNGTSPVTIELYSIYTDAGAIASDNIDGDITGSIVIVNSVVNTTIGTYDITYDVTDSSGNPAIQVIRTVYVNDNAAPFWSPIPSDQINEYGLNFSYEVNATDPDIPIIYGLNDTTNFSIDGNGLIKNNISILNVSIYTLNITATDNYGNTNFTIITVTVQDTTPPFWSPPPSDQRIASGKNFSYDVNAIDISTPISYNLNDTANFSIDQNGLLRNNSVLNIGTYGLNISAADKYGNTIYSVITVTVQEYYKLFTFDADFNEGTFVGLEHDTVHDQLQLSKTSTAFPFIWVPNYDGTISKVDTVNGSELGRYRVAPTPSNPSRTTVDLKGNVWVGNRQAGTVVKVGLYEAGQCIDRSGNGNIETSQDTNSDGDITGSELLAWGQDECVLYEVVLISGKLGTFVPGTYTGGYDINYWGTSPRGLAVDKANNLWAGVGLSYFTGAGPSGTGIYYHINETGMINISRTLDISSYSHTPYGAVIDRNGILWSAHLSSHVLKINLSRDPVNITMISIPNTYGLGLDFQDHLFVGGNNQLSKLDINDIPNPVLWTKSAKVIQGVTVTSDNNVWVAGNSLNSVSRYDNNGNLVATISGLSTPSGVAVDAAGKVWEADIGSEYIRRINTSTNTVDLSKRIIGSGGHYTYSDMTGSVIRGITTSTGTWTVVYDSVIAGAIWGRLSWNSYVPSGASIIVRVKSAESVPGLQVVSYQSLNNGNDFSMVGRFIQIETTLTANPLKESPVLYDLSIDQAGTRIMGKVFENGNIGIPGVKVSTNTSISNVTNETGYYLLNVPEGSYILTATLEPEYYVNNSVIVNTSPEADVAQDIELAKKPMGRITGNVTRAI